ncbi:hypothetical protein Micbo1qcDRAFT_29068 [Microdochium bolleyi]|uniref:Uncharacterized protein n=1 Tax=Microdochium bolleyi TaxID=196109 RepID=A0A136JF78_9PEZI|nr:hypothetical protein Micbo1qcDRAFT_29068 [Microdochium bolleyi]
MEALQLAQMLADLNDLQAAQDQNASKALVSANKTLDRKEQAPPAPHRNSDAVTPGSPHSSARRMTDKFGRRIFTPPISRTNSGVSATPVTAPGTPRDEGVDTDIDRASTLLSLYELRAKVREQDNSALIRAREKISALTAKQQAVTGVGQKRASADLASRYNYPK